MANELVPSRWRTMLFHSGLLIVCATALFAANEVSGIRGSIEIIRLGTKGNMLHVSDMVEVINDSRPPLTRVGNDTFEAYLPAQAKIDSVLAAGPDKIGKLISATPVAGEPGHFTVNFPLRPGATKFAFNYDVPYQGHTVFLTRLRYPLQQLAVMIPATMKFSSRADIFQLLPTGSATYLVEAASEVNAGAGPEFEISGTGELPPLQPGAPAKPPVVGSSIPTGDHARAGGHTANSTPAPSSPLVPSSRSQWWLLGTAAMFTLGAFAFLLLRKRKTAVHLSRNSVISPVEPNHFASRVDLLNEELSRLEIDRSQGAITPAEFESARQALEGTVKRALARASQGTA
jgi:hypothetical protein